MLEVFIDSSVLVAAVLSSAGGSFRVLREAHDGRIMLSTNEYVLEESGAALRRKRPDAAARLFPLLSWSTCKVLEDSSDTEVAVFIDATHPEDAPILAGAVMAHAKILLTLDRKHFFTPKLRMMHLPFFIATPGDFFQNMYAPPLPRQ